MNSSTIDFSAEEITALNSLLNWHCFSFLPSRELIDGVKLEFQYWYNQEWSDQQVIGVLNSLVSKLRQGQPAGVLDE